MSARGRSKKAQHVVIDANKGGAFVCTHCDAEESPSYPVRLDVFTAHGKAFTREHARCPKKAAT